MIHTRRFPRRLVFLFALPFVGVSAVWATIVYCVYAYAGWRFIAIPFLPIATIGTAVAFYVGFKNNSSYERFWEGRKIWGAVVNVSRSWANAVLAYVDHGDESERALETRRWLIYRQLAWINALRLQLRSKSRFFHKPARGTKRRLENHAEHMRNDWTTEISPFLPPEEFEFVTARKNSATHIVAKQGEVLADLQASGRLDLFRQIDLMDMLRELYTLQGKCERIKNTPFPRQYAEYSRVFTRVFLFLVPFGLLDVFDQHLETATGLGMLAPIVPMLLSAVLISWVFGTMEAIGDASEDPFERSLNDVPMNALCRTIEIDLKELLGETELPAPEQPTGNILY